MLVMSEGLMHFGYEKIQVLYCILVKMWSKKSSKSRKCSLHVQQNRIFFPVDTNPLNGMVRDVSVTDLKPRSSSSKKGEKMKLLEDCVLQQANQPHSERFYRSFRFQRRCLTTSHHTSSSHTQTHGDVYEKIGLSVSQNIISIKPSPQQIGPWRAERCVQEEGIKHNE